MGLDDQASCSLEISKMILIKHRNPVLTEESMVSASQKDASSSSVLMESMKMKSRLCLKSSIAWSTRNYPHIPVQTGRGLALIPCL